MTTLETFYNQINNRHEALQPKDIIRDQASFAFKADEANGQLIDIGSGKNYFLTEHATSQLCSRYDIPHRFFQKLPSHLRNLNMNYLVQNEPKKTKSFLRLVNNNIVRGILTDRFAPFDDLELFQIVQEIFQDQEVEVQWNKIGDHSTHCRILFPKTMGEVRKGDIVQSGLHISNSETGCRSIRLDGVIYRLACLNGLVLPNTESRSYMRHIGSKDRLRSHITGMIEDVKLKNDDNLKKFRRSVEVPVNNPVEKIEEICKQEKLTKDDFNSVLNSFMLEAEENMFAVINGFTNAAQSYADSDPDKRYDLERIAAKLLY